MNQVFHKFFVKTTAVAAAIAVLSGGIVPQYASAKNAQIYVQSTDNTNIGQQQSIGYSLTTLPESSVSLRVKSFLGTLDEKITVEEREKVTSIVENIIKYESKRRAQNIYQPSKLEESSIKELNKYLNELTLKYFPDAKKLAEQLQNAYVRKTSVKNPIIENIKSYLTNSDYKKIKKLYEDYAKEKIDLNEAADEIYGILLKYNKLKADDVLINIFTVDNGLVAQFTINSSNLSLTYQNPAGTGLKKISNKKITEYKKAWKELRKILPDNLLKDFKEFDISTDGKYGLLAYVQNLDQKGKYWKISIDPADMDDKEEFAKTVIHEFAHYLSLNASQAVYINEKTDAESVMEDFDLYTESYLVAKKNSYINQFYNEFWKDFAIDRNINTSSQLFYFRHSDEFINTYASTSCAEDFAECFSNYVIPPKVGLFEKRQKKLDFFDQFSEIKGIKEQIITHMKKNGIL